MIFCDKILFLRMCVNMFHILCDELSDFRHSFKESVIFPPFLFLSSLLFWSHHFLSPYDTNNPSVRGRSELRKACP